MERYGTLQKQKFVERGRRAHARGIAGGSGTTIRLLHFGVRNIRWRSVLTVSPIYMAHRFSLRIMSRYGALPWIKKKNGQHKVNSTPFVIQYTILFNKWGVLLCQKEYRIKNICQIFAGYNSFRDIAESCGGRLPWTTALLLSGLSRFLPQASHHSSRKYSDSHLPSRISWTGSQGSRISSIRRLFSILDIRSKPLRGIKEK